MGTSASDSDAVTIAVQAIKASTEPLIRFARVFGLSGPEMVGDPITVSVDPPKQLVSSARFDLGEFGIGVFTYAISGQLVAGEAAMSFVRFRGRDRTIPSEEIVRLVAVSYPYAPDRTRMIDDFPAWQKVKFPRPGQYDTEFAIGSVLATIGAMQDVLIDGAGYLRQSDVKVMVGALAAVKRQIT